MADSSFDDGEPGGEDARELRHRRNAESQRAIARSELERIVDARILRAMNDIDIDFGEFGGRRRFKDAIGYAWRMSQREEEVTAALTSIKKINSLHMDAKREGFKAVITAIIASLFSAISGAIAAFFWSGGGHLKP